MTVADASGLAGLRVVAFESRMNTEMASLIARQGGTPRVVPSLREVPREENAAALAFGEALLAGAFDVVVLLTGVGTRYLVETLETRHDRARIVEALGRTALVARGPKPARVLRELGLAPAVLVPEPNTWRDLLRALDERLPIAGRRVAVQEYGVANEALYDGLEERGGVVTRVPVYQWRLPDDVRPLAAAIGDLIEGREDVLIFTNAAQVNHVMQVA